MTKANKDMTVGGQNDPSESDETAVGAVAKIASHLAQFAVGPDGQLLPKAEFQMNVRDPEGRDKILEQLVLEICPNGISQTAWRGWLNGGFSPFVEKPKKAGIASEKPGQTLSRTSSRVRGQEKRVATLREQLEEAEEQLTFIKSYENAALHWHTIDQLMAIMAPAFAMGPAWTIMRSVSAHISDEAADKMTLMLFGEEKEESIAEYRLTRVKETRDMLEALDWFSGFSPFEEELRCAVMKVCKDFESKRGQAGSDGRRARSETKMKTEAHPKAVHDADEVLAGLAREATDQS